MAKKTRPNYVFPARNLLEISGHMKNESDGVEKATCQNETGLLSYITHKNQL